jgi:hypothetical protein
MITTKWGFGKRGKGKHIKPQQVIETMSESTTKPSASISKDKINKCDILAFVLFVTGFGLVGLSQVEKLFRQARYVCGEGPPSQAIDANLLICLNLQANNQGGGFPSSIGPLCLEDGSADEPPAWCNTMTKSHLWWSPCTRCGTAWHIFSERDNEKSWYKEPASISSSLQGPQEDGWLVWNDAKMNWSSTTVSISECESSRSMDGIPNVCFVEIENKAAKIVSLIVGILLAVTGLVVLCCSGAIASTHKNQTDTNDTADNNIYDGGGDGFGGSGCGGGGGCGGH